MSIKLVRRTGGLTMPNKLTDKEIVKALECCATVPFCNEKTDCPYRGIDDCVKKNTFDALDLINRLQEDKQNLEIELQAMRNAANGFKAEVERLKKFALIRAFDRFQKEAKTEAYKEFAERLKESSIATFSWNGIVMVDDIDNLLKELVGEDNG